MGSADMDIDVAEVGVHHAGSPGLATTTTPPSASPDQAGPPAAAQADTPPLTASASVANQKSPGRVPQRAPTACLRCKSRKVKCSNDRPKCTGCLRSRCECVYPDDKHGRDDNTASAYQEEVMVALREILERLPPKPVGSSENPTPLVNPMTTTMATQTITSPPAPTVSPYPVSVSSRAASGYSSAHEPGVPHESQSPLHHALVEHHGISTPYKLTDYTSADWLFRWPIFANGPAQQWPQTPSILSAKSAQNKPEIVAYHRETYLQYDPKIIPLVEKFLQHVHVKNPILDAQSLLADASAVYEKGISWDAPSCLVLLACALGVIAEPFDATFGRDQILDNRDDLRYRADTYYQEARRRFGLLDGGLVACQCHLLSGIYSMYRLRPIQAWQSFVQASTMCTMYLSIHGRLMPASSQSTTIDHDHDLALRSLEQRLYWSCLKSECEIINEMPLPRSALCTVSYPHLFPSPPPADETKTDNASSRAAGSTEVEDAERKLHDQSWFYYLTEISLLRLSNRIVDHFYMRHPSTWCDMNIMDMCKSGHMFDQQLQEWQDSLPEPIRPSLQNNSTGDDQCTELQFTTWARFSHISGLLYRPFLYRYLHPSPQDRHVRHLMQPFAFKYVKMCMHPPWIFTASTRHRHHGTWFGCRKSICSMLVLLAAIEDETLWLAAIGNQVSYESVDTSRISALEVNAVLFEKLYLYRDHLKLWEEESDDLVLARQILTEMEEFQYDKFIRQSEEQEHGSH